jgi:hypothetical protein
MLYLPRDTLQPGVSYTVQATATSKYDAAATSSTTFELMVEPLSLRAVIAGGDRSYSTASSSELVLNGSASSGSGVASWLCTLDRDGSLCFGGNLLNSFAVAAINVLRVPNNQLPAVNETLVFSLRLRNNFSTSLATARIAVKTLPVPQVTIVADSSVVLVSLPLRLQARVEDDCTYIFEWSCDRLDDLSLKRVASTSTTSQYLVVAAGALISGRFVFKVHARRLVQNVLQDGVGEASIVIVTNARPVGGACSISGPAPVAFYPFVVSCAGWDDVDTPLSYSFGIKQASTMRTLVAFQRAGSASVVLPAGVHLVVCSVRDAWGEEATYQLNVTVAAATSKVNLVEGLKDSAETLSGNKFSQLLFSLTDSLNVNASSGTGRRLLQAADVQATAQRAMGSRLLVEFSDATFTNSESLSQQLDMAAALLSSPTQLDCSYRSTLFLFLENKFDRMPPFLDLKEPAMRSLLVSFNALLTSVVDDVDDVADNTTTMAVDLQGKPCNSSAAEEGKALQVSLQVAITQGFLAATRLALPGERPLLV